MTSTKAPKRITMPGMIWHVSTLCVGIGIGVLSSPRFLPHFLVSFTYLKLGLLISYQHKEERGADEPV